MHTSRAIARMRQSVRCCGISLVLALSGFWGCSAAVHERALHRDLAAAASELAPLAKAPLDLSGTGPQTRSQPLLNGDGSIQAYVTYAMRQSPALRAAFERWRAHGLRISRARRLPEPTLSYGYFVRPIETRLGPQRHRLSLTQSLPWPAELAAATDAATAAARAAQMKFAAAALELRQQIAQTYWQLWFLDRTNAVHHQQHAILQSLAASLRARVEVGRATLAELGQIDLATARHEDALTGLDEAALIASAQLVALVGAPPGTPTPVRAVTPTGIVPAESEAALQRAAMAHPQILTLAQRVAAESARARRAALDRYPDIALQLDYTEIGAAPGAAPGSTDAVMASVAVQLPLWQDNYADAERTARADSAAYYAATLDARDRAVSALTRALSQVRDTARRIRLHANTLIPQAEAVYGSVVGSYESDRSPISAVLLAQREVLNLKLDLARAQRDHAIAWADLEYIAGRSVAREVGDE